MMLTNKGYPVIGNVSANGEFVIGSFTDTGLKVLTITPPANPWLEGYSYRKAITINHTKVSATLLHLPILVSITSDTDIGSHALPSGSDIRFTESDKTTVLDYEIESFEITGGACTAAFWVKVPLLSSSVDTTIYIYYGKADAVDAQNKNKLWMGYTGVWHLNNDPTGTSPQMLDSSPNNNHGINYGDMLYTQLVACNFGKGLSLEGDDYVILPQNIATNKPALTLSVWFKTTDANGCLVQQYYGSSAYSYMLNIHNGIISAGVGTTSDPLGSVNDFDIIDTATTNDGNWHNAVLTYDSSYVRLYVDGVQKTPKAKTGNIHQQLRDFSIHTIGVQAYNPPPSITAQGDTYLTGVVSEVRLSTTCLPESLLLTEYNNQSSPSTFFLPFGAEESQYSAWSSHDQYIVADHPGAGYQASFDLTWKVGFNADFSDLRITDGNNLVVPYWIESKTDSSTAKVWIKFPSTSETLYIHYGKADTVSESSGNAVFEFFDSFENTTKLTVTYGTAYAGLVSYTSGKTDGQSILVDGNLQVRGIHSTVSITNGHVFEAWHKIPTNYVTTNIGGICFGATSGTTIGYQALTDIRSGTGNNSDMQLRRDNITTTIGTYSASDIQAGVWYRLKVIWKTNGVIIYTVYNEDGSVFGSCTANNTLYGTGVLGFHAYGKNIFDDLRVRKYVETEPTIAPAGGQPELLQKAYTASSDIFLNKPYTALADLFINAPYTSLADILLSKGYTTPSDIEVIKTYSAGSDILVSTGYTSIADILLNKPHTSTSDLLVSKVYESYTDIISAILQKAFTSTSDIQLNKTFASGNNISVYKIFVSTNDLHNSQVYTSRSDILTSKTFTANSDVFINSVFISSNDLIELLTKLFSSTNDIFLDTSFVGASDVQVSKIFSSTSDIVIRVRSTDYDFPLTVVISKISRTADIVKTIRTANIDQ